MLNKNAQKWVDALRSGEYKQTDNALCSNNKYCCLGVACEVYLKDNPNGIQKEQLSGYSVIYDRDDCTLPKTVQKWLGLSTNYGGFDFGKATVDGEEILICKSLISLNDDEKWTFEQIADLIETNPTDMFGEPIEC